MCGPGTDWFGTCLTCVADFPLKASLKEVCPLAIDKDLARVLTPRVLPRSLKFMLTVQFLFML